MGQSRRFLGVHATSSYPLKLTMKAYVAGRQPWGEVIGERVRDKIAASKRKGSWVGGPVPLGYRCINKKLVVVPGEAETVRTIFRRYLDCPRVRVRQVL